MEQHGIGDMQAILLLLNFGGFVVTGVFGWFARQLWSSNDHLKAEIAKLREELPRQYVSKEDYHNDVREWRNRIDNDIRELKEMFKDWNEKLDRILERSHV